MGKNYTSIKGSKFALILDERLVGRNYTPRLTIIRDKSSWNVELSYCIECPERIDAMKHLAFDSFYLTDINICVASGIVYPTPIASIVLTETMLYRLRKDIKVWVR